MVDMQKEPAKAGSFFDGKGKMMGSRLWWRLRRSINLAMPEGLRWQISLVSSAPREDARRGGEGTGDMKESGEMRLKGGK
ncbi:MAG: hypothetical protein MR962_04915 [Dialister sp.]|nr:hypothetical protein [Dialister sp.]